MRHAIAAVLLSLVALLLVACSSTPQYTHCNYDAKRAIKLYLENPSTFDEHGLLTISSVKHLSHVFPWGTEGEYTLDTGIIFGAKNSFGVSQDYIAWFTAKVDADGDCYDIEVTDIHQYEG